MSVAGDRILSVAPPGALTDRQQDTVYQPRDKWSDDFAVKIVASDFSTAETYRSSAHDWRWRAADELYLGWVGQKFWEGTRVPRSSLGVYLAFEQIESLLPKVLSSIFGDTPYFECDPRPGTSPKEAQSVQYLIQAQLEEMLFREEIRKGIKSALIYGNGFWEMGYETIEKTRRLHLLERIPKKFDHPMFGPVPTGEFSTRFKWKDVKEKINRPWVKYWSTKDVYISPNLSSPDLRKAPYVITRALMTVEEIDALRKDTDFRIPSEAGLVALSKNKSSAQADQDKAVQEAFRDASYNPWVDYETDPAKKRIEVLVYTTQDRLVWTMNRSHLAYNEPNPYGYINYYNTVYTDVPDRCYGLAITDVIEGEQRFQTATINARIDELSLSIHPQTIKRQGVQIPAAQLRRRPGGMIEVQNPKEDIVREDVQNITQGAYLEIQASDSRVQKTTGLSDLAVLGAPSSGGNSAGRTATGVSTQASAAFSRIQYLIENIESQVIEPMLFDMHTLNIRYLDPEQILKVLGPQGESIQLDPMAILNAEVKFSMRASARIQSKQAILQAYPLIAQTLMNPAFLQMLAQQQHKTLDVDEFANIIIEASGYKSRVPSLFREMSEEEIQSMNQTPPAEQMKLQMQQERLAAQGEHVETKSLTEIVKTILAAAGKSDILGLGEESDTTQS